MNAPSQVTSRLVVVIHHVAADMQAMEIMQTELSAHCTALTLGRLPPPSPPLQYEYADYSLWEQHAGAGYADSDRTSIPLTSSLLCFRG